MRRPESTINLASGSRFSSSTMASQYRASMNISPRASTSSDPPRRGKDEVANTDAVPRVSLSTDDGQNVDMDAEADAASTGHLLPPIPFPTSSLTETLNDFSSERYGTSQRSRPLSTASKRMSFMTELRSKRDTSDTASFMTVDEITANVESRRESLDEPTAPSSPGLSEEITLVNEFSDEEDEETLDIDGSAGEEEDLPEPAVKGIAQPALSNACHRTDLGVQSKTGNGLKAPSLGLVPLAKSTSVWMLPVASSWPSSRSSCPPEASTRTGKRRCSLHWSGRSNCFRICNMTTLCNISVSLVPALFQSPFL